MKLTRTLIRPVIGVLVAAGILVSGFAFHLQREIPVQIRLAASPPQGVQVYYRTKPDEAFSQKRVRYLRPFGTPATAEVSIHAHQLCGLRFDFGSAPGEVTILGGKVGDHPLPKWKDWRFSSVSVSEDAMDEAGTLKIFSDMMDPYMSVSFRRPIQSKPVFRWDVISFSLLCALAIAVAFAMNGGLFSESGSAKRFSGGSRLPAAIGLFPCDCLFLLAIAAYYTLWIFQPLNFSPDEAMRFEVTRFLFDHGRLPVNEETINELWGVSYAHLPTMFCNVFGAPFMKIGALFTHDATALLRAARMLGVLCITGTVYWTIRTSRLLFKEPFNWLPTCIVAFLPQFAYVGSYVNNDSAALLGCSMILFAWVSAIGGRWNYGNATILSIGIAICATSYYNSYSWILFSLLMFPLTYAVRNGRQGMIRMGLFVSVASLVLGGYLFLRPLYLYGDLLGFATSKRFAMQYAAPAFSPGFRKPPCECGRSLMDMLWGMKWVSLSSRSFIGQFGYMVYVIPSWCYASYAAVFGLGGLGALWKGADWIRERRRIAVCRWALLVSLIGCIVITIGLSMYYSFVRDCQPQGRYCFPALLPIALLSAKGMERLISGTALRKIQKAFVFALCLILGTVSGTAYMFFLSWQ